MRIFVLAASFILVASFSAPLLAVAQTVTSGGGNNQTITSGGGNNTSGTNVTLLNPLKGVDCSKGNGDCLAAFLLNILDFVITIGSIVVIFMLVLVGFKFVVARGSDTKITEARTMLLWTVIGALVLLGSKAIALGVQATVSALGG